MRRAIFGGIGFAVVLVVAWFAFGVIVDTPSLITVIVACAVADAAREIA